MPDENQLRQGSQIAHEAAEVAEAAGEKIGHTLEIAEHAHMVEKFVRAAIPVAPPLVLRIVGVSRDFLALLVLTAPLTISVALIFASIRRKWFDSELWTYFIFPCITLLGSSYVSSWSRIGRPIDWHKVLPYDPVTGQAGSWVTIPFRALGEYYNVYGAPAFFLSAAAGMILGLYSTRERS